MSNKKSYPKQKKQLNKLVRFSGIAFQMVTIISLGSFLGYQLDLYFGIINSIFTIVFSLLSITVALVYVIQQTKEKKY
ncbi:AtpZ/AtpI family protein [Flavobacteriaceae bacterium]|nr:AtpZ/AtpI family protein [Flavobacteriaceae bacterium]MDA9067209.1 AtpZ/AtpI family protein [Flavobacteriaceae bacterium]MDB4212653.1 AtpZ/AtpI family protein [Flavobacteriaceae bacterium]MDC0496786.1 AtpZ/AtpI family protein [Flavobacteriaceae bacterium]MDC1310785.1 AtpZ/AtpI family protein [Flavobacteriaceae bacterium]